MATNSEVCILSDVRNGFDGIKVKYKIDADDARRDQGARRPVAEAVGGLRYRHESDERHRRSGLNLAERRSGGGLMRTTTVIIGAGHAGLAMSRCLAERSIDHVVLERV